MTTKDQNTTRSDLAEIPARAASYIPNAVENWDGNGPSDVAEALDEIGNHVFFDFFNGIFLETFDALVTESGGVLTLSVEKSGGGNLTMVFSDGRTTFVAAPATIVLTAGTNAVPVENFVYILQSDKILTRSTAWPAAEHIKVGYFYAPSAARVSSRGVNINQNWNDHAQDLDTKQGHLTHILERMRRTKAIWLSGCQGVATVDVAETPDAVWVSIASGQVSQMHPHAFPALDTDPAGGNDVFYVVNDFASPNKELQNLTDLDNDSNGVALGNNKFFSVVVAGVANKTGEFSPMLLALPSGVYNTLLDAQNDVEGHTNFEIAREYQLESTTGFLVVQFILKNSTNMTLEDTIDLRGKTPGTAPGSGTGGGDVAAAAALADNAIIRGDGGAKDVQDSGVLIDDSNNMTGMGTVDGRDIAADGALLDTALQNVVEDTSPELGGEMDAGLHTIGFTLQTATGDGTTTIDWKLGNHFDFTFGAQNETFTFTAPTNPCVVTLALIQDGTGSRTATWPAAIHWVDKIEPVLTLVGGSKDLMAFRWDGTNYLGIAAFNFGSP